MKTNIVLIGMTGSGKSSVGKLLSQQLDLPFRDMDLFIEQLTNQSIPELFEVSEAYFRAIETEACAELAAKETYAVISCGGGVVLNPENIEALRKTGWVIFIDRPVEHIIKDIEIGHRPLLKEGKNKLYQLYEERFDLYQSSADFSVENRSDLEDVLNEIKHHLPEIIAHKGEDNMKIVIINGPNLNFLGTREPEIYGTQTLEEIESKIQKYAETQEVDCSFFQSNSEGELIDRIQQAHMDKADGIVLNPAAYTHYSYAIHDAVKSIMIPTVEVHLSAIHARESFRKESIIASACIGQISGFGPTGYLLAIHALKEVIK